jgi:hypothetical protein
VAVIFFGGAKPPTCRKRGASKRCDNRLHLNVIDPMSGHEWEVIPEEHNVNISEYHMALLKSCPNL